MSSHTEYLATSEGALVSISIAVQPKGLEALLDALAGLDFPVNPGIYHDAALVTRFPDGEQQTEPTTLVEFPAYSERVADVRRVVEHCGLDSDSIQVTGMLEEIQGEEHREPVPVGANYVSRCRVRHAYHP